MPKQTYQIHISLNFSKPLIWRRILVNDNTDLIDFHKIIQSAMGWTNSHLHQFMIGKKTYAPEEFELEETKDSAGILLNTLLKKVNDKLKYEYDFGDGWVHEILLEKILPYDKTVELPLCLDGKRSCPPEDCGGLGGYERLIEIVADPKHIEHEEMMEWLGGEFDPDYFDIIDTNLLLKEEDYGCIWL